MFIFSVFLQYKKTMTVKSGPLDFTLSYLPLQDFCTDVPDDDQRLGRNMQHARKCATRL